MRVECTVNKRKWRVVDERPPQARRGGHVEAIAQTPIMDFRKAPEMPDLLMDALMETIPEDKRPANWRKPK